MHRHFQRAQLVIDDAIHGMSNEQLVWHKEGKWSAADILDHLSLAYSGSTMMLERCLRDGPTTKGTPTWSQRLKTFGVTVLHHMPTGWRAPSPVVPKGSAPETVTANLRRQLLAADDAIWRCEARFGHRTRVADHPLLGPLTAPQWRLFHFVHTQHHMKQIAKIRTQMRTNR
jgi:hypothetical protein